MTSSAASVRSTAGARSGINSLKENRRREWDSNLLENVFNEIERTAGTGKQLEDPYRVSVQRHVPAFFDLLTEETEPAVRVVLGHFIFVYIHPYMDGNGRMGRLLMNTMMAAGGYPCTVIPLPERNAYMASLKKGSVGEDIGPFADLVAHLIERRLAGEPLPEVPKAELRKAHHRGP